MMHPVVQVSSWVDTVCHVCGHIVSFTTFTNFHDEIWASSPTPKLSHTQSLWLPKLFVVT